MASRFEAPDVLVLAAGGVVGEAWMSGVLRGVADSCGFDFGSVEAYVGTSAGSIVCASLAAGRQPRGPVLPEEGPGDVEPSAASVPEVSGPPSVRTVVGVAGRRLARLASPLSPAALRYGEPVGARARSAILARVPSGTRSLAALRREVESWGARFDGRLRVCAVDVDTGRRVVFGAPGAPEAGVGEAVEASCAVPGVFRPVVIGGRTYVDGGAWSLTNLDAAPAGRGTRVLCLTLAGGAGPAFSPAGLARAVTRPVASVEAAALRRRGAHVRIVAPDRHAAPAVAGNPLSGRGAGAALAAGYEQGLRLAGATG